MATTTAHLFLSPPPIGGSRVHNRRLHISNLPLPSRNRRDLRMRSEGVDILGDFGARDPFPAEIESRFGEKVLGNVSTEHKILIPNASALCLSELECSPVSHLQAPMTMEDAKQLLFKRDHGGSNFQFISTQLNFLRLPTPIPPPCSLPPIYPIPQSIFPSLKIKIKISQSPPPYSAVIRCEPPPSAMPILVNCSNCHTPLQLPPRARSIRCALCKAVTLIADPRSAPPPSLYSAASSHQFQPSRAQPGPISSPYGRKRAVICAVSYKNTQYELDGCINDAKCMKYLLINRFKFPESSIIMLTEEETDPYKRPTKYNMRMALYWLVQGCKAGDSLVFHFSGHGSQQTNHTGDELDGFDETLCPSDFETQGMIVDDEINATIVKPLPSGVKLHAIVDACHSGTVLDLPYLCRMDRNGRYVWEDHRPRSGAWKGTSGGEVISFSGCDDNQTSSDTSALSKVTSTGAMTYSFIQAIERGHGATYGSMLNAMRSTIRNTDGLDGGIVTSLLTMLGSGGRTRQEPQLTANEQFDVYRKPFSL